MSDTFLSFYVVRLHLKVGGYLDFRFDDLGHAKAALDGVLAGKKSGKPMRVFDGAGTETHFDDADVQGLGPVTLLDIPASAAAATRSIAIAGLAERIENERLARMGIVTLAPEAQPPRAPANGTGGGPGIPAPGSFLPASPGGQPPFAG
jgi:hypothetical protein